jgi:hypothetical protein
MAASISSIQDIIDQLHDWVSSPQVDQLDISEVASTSIDLITTQIATSVEDEQDSPLLIQNIKIGIITFNHMIQFYWVRPTAPEPISEIFTRYSIDNLIL